MTRLVLVLALMAMVLAVYADDVDGDSEPLAGACEVCTYVIQNKQNGQPYLCRGLTDPGYQKACVRVLESMLWWLPNEVYWMNYGCQKSGGNNDWYRNCPPHAICSWLQDLTSNQPFCPVDPEFPRPS